MKLATAESTHRFLDKAQNLGINTNDVFFFLNNQGNIRKIKTNVKHNSTLCLKHNSIASDLMSFKVTDQALVVQHAAEARSRARESLRATAGSSKKFRNAIHHLNCMAKQTTDILEEL